MLNVSLFLLKGTKMARYVSGTPRGSVFTPCTSSARRESSTQMPTQMTTWTRAVRESGLHFARSVSPKTSITTHNQHPFISTAVYSFHQTFDSVFIIFQYIRWAALTHIATTLGLAFRRSICVNTADIWQWLELQDKWVCIWEFKRWLTRFTHIIKTSNAKMVTFVQLLLYCTKMLGWQDIFWNVSLILTKSIYILWKYS